MVNSLRIKWRVWCDRKARIASTAAECAHRELCVSIRVGERLGAYRWARLADDSRRAALAWRMRRSWL